MVFEINFDDYIYVREFYKKIVPKLKEYLTWHSEKDLLFNFSDLAFLSPTVIPNILNIADCYMNRFNRKIILNLSWNPDLLSYLCTVDFFKYSDELNLFDYDKKILGGFVTYSTKYNCRLIFSEKGSSEDDIKAKVNYLKKTMENYKWLKLDKNLDKNDDVKLMFEDIFFHLIHNSNDIKRGFSNAYGIFQINEYEKNKKAYISVCDGGFGIKATILDKFENRQAKPLIVKEKDDPTYKFIIEALFWRKIMNKNNPYRHGVYNVANYVLGKKGTIGIHSNDTYFLFTDKFYETFCEISREIDSHDSNSYVDILNVELKAAIDKYAVFNSMTKFYKGVHIDIVIPLGVKND